MKYIKVINNEIIGYPIELTGTYITDTGETICGVEHLTDDEKRELNLYPVTENIPAYDSSYQFLSNPIYTILENSVEITYEVKNNTAIYPKLLEQRLADFAKEKDIDLNEVGLLMNCLNSEWQAQAVTFTALYAATWQAFYATTSTDWAEIEATLPTLSWSE
jgi:hypothetical protein